MQCFWECGGNLAAPAVVRCVRPMFASAAGTVGACHSACVLQMEGVFHKVYAFIAPKLIGGHTALGPLGDIGLHRMTDALPLHELSYDLFGPDIMISGYLPPSGGLVAVGKRCYAKVTDSTATPEVIRFYKAWDEFGALSNFSPHPVVVSHMDPECREWPTVEVRIMCSWCAFARCRNVQAEVERCLMTVILPSPEIRRRAVQRGARGIPCHSRSGHTRGSRGNWAGSTAERTAACETRLGHGKVGCHARSAAFQV